jgi:hypothetical protein
MIDLLRRNDLDRLSVPGFGFFGRRFDFVWANHAAMALL